MHAGRSTVIDCLQNIFGVGDEFALAYHYCDYSEEKYISSEVLLGTLLSQILKQRADIDVLAQLDILKARSRYPTLEDLKKALYKLGSAFPKTFIIIDALDELPNRSGVVDFITELAMFDGKFKVFVSSRKESDLENIFSFFAPITITPDRVENDIERYVRSRVSTLRWQNVPALEEIIQELVRRADGMQVFTFTNSLCVALYRRC
jgi:hypothetical protein